MTSTRPLSYASKIVIINKDAGAVTALDRFPFSDVSAKFMFNLNNEAADLYGIRASLLDGGEIKGAGNAWIFPEANIIKKTTNNSKSSISTFRNYPSILRSSSA